MRILDITLTNYGAFQGEHKFTLADRGLTLVLGDNRDAPRMNSNGAGKSTIFDALDWCLFGVVPRGDHVDSIVNDVAGKDCSVKVRLDDAGDTVLVERYRKKSGKTSGLTLSVDGADLTSLDTSETQQSLENILGVNRDVFHAAVLFGQFDLFSFADATDAQRMDILTQILGLSEINSWLVRAKEALKDLDDDAAQHRADLERAEGELSGVRSVDLTDRLQAWEAEHAATLKQYHDTLTNIQAQVAVIDQELATLPERQQKLEAARNNRPTPPNTAELEAARDSAERTLRSTETHVSVCAMRRRGLEERKAKLDAMGAGTCSECGQEVTGQHLDHERARLQQEIVSLDAEALEYAGPMAQWRQYLAEVSDQLERAKVEHDQALDRHRNHIIELERLVSNLSARQREAQQLRESLQRTTESLETAKTAVNPFTRKQQELDEQAATLEATIAALHEQLKTYTEQRAYLDFWVTGFGPKGLKNYILDTRLEEMTREANRWVWLLTGGTVWVRFETQTMGRSTKRLSNKINVRVFRYNPDGSITERNYKSWSGGERHRVSLGIDFGLSRLIARRARKSYDILILDELFRHLDHQGREAVVEMLHELRHDKSSLFVIDHDAEFQEAFENRVVIRKEHGASTIVEATADEAE